VHQGTADLLANITFYVLVILGVIVGLEASGINLSALTVVFGALGVGIGFGLQTIASNFISGLIILFERPIRVGDTIQLGDLHGRVMQIRGRATEVLTNDSITVIVPNSEFISQRVINWTHGSNSIRVHVPVSVAQGSDVAKVQRVLLEAAGAVPAVLESPPPKVWMRGFTATAMEFELLAWTTELLHTRGEFVSQLNFAVHDALKRHGIEMPALPQQVVVRPASPVEAALKGPEQPV
jgi:small-conductance mechanosensitive channel